MTEIIGHNKIRTTQWEDLISWVKDKGFDPSPVARQCSRSKGRHRVGFCNTLTLSTDGKHEYSVKLGTPNEYIKIVEQNSKNADNRSTIIPSQESLRGRKALHIAIYTARSNTKGKVEFRAARHEAVIRGAVDEISHDKAAPLLVHLEYPSTNWSNPRIIYREPIYESLLKVLPWITDYQLADRVFAKDLDACLTWTHISSDSPKYVRKYTELLLHFVTEFTNAKIAKDIRI